MECCECALVGVFILITVEWEHGLLASCFDTSLPTHQICIVILRDGVDPCSLGLPWKHPRRLYFFINCATIRQRLDGVKPDALCLLDCRPLQQIERHMGRRPRPVDRSGTCDSWYDRVFIEELNKLG